MRLPDLLGRVFSFGNRGLQHKATAVDRVMAVIEFDLDGRILDANPNFLELMGYRLDEVVGRHHRMFVTPADRDSESYRQFWEALRRGDFNAGRFCRLDKHGREVWINASYDPLLDRSGKAYRVVKYATDVTRQVIDSADADGRIQAIDKVMGVIEFDLKGNVLGANENFLNILGYPAAEAIGQHHSVFVDAAYRASAQYRQFWAKLASGQFDAGRYRRLRKDGRAVWIQASYNPILDVSGRPYKVVKYATDVTDQVRSAERMRDLMLQTMGIAQNVQREARHISASNQELVSRVSTQSDAVEQTSSTIDQLAATVRANSENAGSARRMAEDSATVARRRCHCRCGEDHRWHSLGDRSHWPDHRGDRRHRVPDQYPGPERCCRSGARR